ncbi:AI-2E family transporter [Rhodoblastus sp. 17X3]|uniref:AI-2E family transporter n=1 Tax=Rhodoblastus sp. 17X3 TaxID=3047026 RepID=UPI0024B813B5|nr:AI-2E family transporter [Rhodoblastus sp. 17X3]MDI9849677.1 AI-2E family transporter [Rhodoblastus sp. 17X3]
MPEQDNQKMTEARGAQALSLDLIIRLCAIAALVYWSIILIQPFLTIGAWSVILTVALYPAYDWLAVTLGGRRRIAAAVLTCFCLAIVIGPALWLILAIIDSLGLISEWFDPKSFLVPPPPARLQTWPLIGEPAYQFWTLASANLDAAFAKIAPQLKSTAAGLLQVAADAGAGALRLFVAIIIAGFMFAPAPAMVEATRRLARRLSPDRGDKFVSMTGATIRTVSRGVLGISALQAVLAGIGFTLAGIPGATLLTSATLLLGIVQIGPSLVILPAIVWAWMSMETLHALLFTLYMVPVNVIDNLLKPLVMTRGLSTPILVILIGVIGGMISYGVTGLFLGPIILAVTWDLFSAWAHSGVSNPPQPSLPTQR